jgi:hypothetical protein
MRLSVVFVAACWAPPPPSQPVAPVQSQPRVAPVPREPDYANEAIPIHSEWSGRYVCGQGPTGVFIAIDAYTTGEAIATFEFAAVPENPGVPNGAYKLRGRLSLSPDGRIQAHFDPDAWLEKPQGYMMVGFGATSDRGHRSMRGTIAHSSCGALELTRSR